MLCYVCMAMLWRCCCTVAALLFSSDRRDQLIAWGSDQVGVLKRGVALHGGNDVAVTVL